MSSCLIICHTEQASFMCLDKLSYSFLRLDQLLPFSLSCLQCHKISPRVFFSAKWLASGPFSVTSSVFKPNPLSSFMLVTLPPLPSSGYGLRVSQMAAMSMLLMVSYFSYSSICVWLEFHCWWKHLFISLLHCPLFWPIASFDSIFIKCCVGSPLRDRETMQPHVLLFVCVDWITDAQ